MTDDDPLDIPPALRRPLPEGMTFREELQRAHAAVASLPGGRFMPAASIKPPRKVEVNRSELSDAEAVKLAQQEAKFLEWQEKGRPGQGTKARVRKAVAAKSSGCKKRTRVVQRGKSKRRR